MTDSLTKETHVTGDPLVKALELLCDNAYLTYMKLNDNDLCKGADWFLTNGKFDRARLDAHTAAHEWLGKHRAYAFVIDTIKGKK